MKVIYLNKKELKMLGSGVAVIIGTGMFLVPIAIAGDAAVSTILMMKASYLFGTAATGKRIVDCFRKERPQIIDLLEIAATEEKDSL